METADQNHCFVLYEKYSSGMAFFKGDPGLLLENNYRSYMWIRKLDLQLPENVDKIGDSIEKLSELTNLYISSSKHLKCLPNTITRLHKLEELWVTDCPDFKCPENLDQLVSLRHLTLQLRDIESLPDCLFKLSNLETLDLRGLSDPSMTFPEKFGQLISLKSLSLFECKLECLPHSITKLPNFETLRLNEAYFLQSLPENLSLQKLKLTNCTIDSLPKGLCHLEIEVYPEENGCVILDYLEQRLDQLVDLKTLSISDYSIKFRTRIPRLHNLEQLVLNCSQLQELPANLHEFVKLSMLKVISGKINSLPCSITGLSNLRELILKDCYNLQEFPENLEELVKLCTLNISGTKIKCLPCCVTKLPNLLSLSLPKCFKLETLPNKLYESVLLSIDGMDMDLNDRISTEVCDEDNGNVMELDSTEEVDEAISEESGQGIKVENTSPNEPLNQSNAAQIREETHYNGRKSSIGEVSQHEILLSESEDWTSALVDQISACQQLSTGGSTCKYNASENERSHTILHSDLWKSKKKKIEITREDVQLLMSKNMRLVDAAKQLGVTRSTMKRHLRKLGISNWPSSRNNKRSCVNKRKHSSESSIKNEPSQLTLKLPSDQSDYKLVHECLDGVNPCKINQGNGNLSQFIVKATYYEDTVRFEFSLTANLDELAKEVAKNLKLELNTFKIKYQDSDKEWMLMTLDTHLDYVLNLSKSSGSNIVRLSIAPM